MRKVTTMQSGGVLFLQVAARREHARAEQILFITRWAAPLRNYIILLLFSQERRDAEGASRAEGATTQLGAPGRHGGGQPRGRGARRGQGGVGDRLACRLLVHLVPSSHLGFLASQCCLACWKTWYYEKKTYFNHMICRDDP